MFKNLKKFQFNYEVGKKTWFGSGGNALIFSQINQVNSICNLLKFIPQKIPIFILGAGSNILVRDGGFNGLVIKLGKNFKKISYNKSSQIIEIGSASKDSEIAKYCLENSIKGFEYLKGIPGTLGGNLVMNAGCYGHTISDLLISCKIISRDGSIQELKKELIHFGYRRSSIPKDSIIISAKFFAKKGNKIRIKNKMKQISRSRFTSQPTNSRTGGSTFKNPPNESAWSLIDKINYRGKKRGGAMVSTQHANFMINESAASSLDIETLGEEIKEKVKKEFKINLDWELERIGNFKKL